MPASWLSATIAVAPVLGGDPVGTPEAWSAVAGRILALALIAAAAWTRGRLAARQWALRIALVLVAVALTAVWLNARAAGASLPDLDQGEALPALLVIAFALQGFLSLLAVIGFGWRYRAYGEDLDRWIALAATLMLSADLHYVSRSAPGDSNGRATVGGPWARWPARRRA